DPAATVRLSLSPPVPTCPPCPHLSPHLSPPNSKGQVAAEVVPDPTDMALDRAEAAEAARELRRLLLDAVPLSCSLPRVTLPNYDNLPGTLMLLCLGLQLGDRVRLDSGKVG
ncbi:hypothetical protein HGM15179_022033, partial [Zosterops borbonicus]